MSIGVSINEMSGVEQVEKMLMDRLFWSNTPVLMSVRPDEEDIKSLRAELDEKLKACQAGPTKYLKFLNHKYLQ